MGFIGAVNSTEKCQYFRVGTLRSRIEARRGQTGRCGAMGWQSILTNCCSCAIFTQVIGLALGALKPFHLQRTGHEKVVIEFPSRTICMRNRAY